jgi:cold shock CspA family protein
LVIPPPVNLEDHDDIIQLDTDRFESIVLSIKDGYGFIKYPPDNVFFHFSSLKDFDFEELRIGDRVEFKIEAKDNGRLTAEEVFVLE